MQRPYRIHTILALIALYATAWMLALPQSAAAMQSSQDSATATIQGTVLKPDGSPAIGANIIISLFSNDPISDESRSLRIDMDPSTATYTANVIPGTWKVGYGLVKSEEYTYDMYNPTSGSVEVSAADGQTANHNITLLAKDTTIRGSVLTPDGTAISEGRVWVTEWFEDGEYYGIPQAVTIVDGVFELQVAGGTEYIIDVDNGGSRENTLQHIANRMVLPNEVEVTVDSVGTTEVVVQLVPLDATITGQIYYEGEPLLKSNIDVQFWALGVWNIHTETLTELRGISKLRAKTDENGKYTIAVPSGITWIVNASSVLVGSGNGIFPDFEDYAGSPTTIDVTEPQAYGMDLTVFSVEPHDVTLPPGFYDDDNDESTGPLASENEAADTVQMTEFVFLPTFVAQQ